MYLTDGDMVGRAAHGASDPAEAALWNSRFPFPLSRDYVNGLAILERRLVDVSDAEAEKDGPMAAGIEELSCQRLSRHNSTCR